MPIKVNLAKVMLDQGVSLTELSQDVGLTMANLSNLKRGNVKAVRFSTLAAICDRLNCQPREMLEYSED